MITLHLCIILFGIYLSLSIFSILSYLSIWFPIYASTCEYFQKIPFHNAYKQNNLETCHIFFFIFWQFCSLVINHIHFGSEIITIALLWYYIDSMIIVVAMETFNYHNQLDISRGKKIRITNLENTKLKTGMIIFFIEIDANHTRTKCNPPCQLWTYISKLSTYWLEADIEIYYWKTQI